MARVTHASLHHVLPFCVSPTSRPGPGRRSSAITTGTTATPVDQPQPLSVPPLRHPCTTTATPSSNTTRAQLIELPLARAVPHNFRAAARQSLTKPRSPRVMTALMTGYRHRTAAAGAGSDRTGAVSARVHGGLSRPSPTARPIYRISRPSSNTKSTLPIPAGCCVQPVAAETTGCAPGAPAGHTRRSGPSGHPDRQTFHIL